MGGRVGTMAAGMADLLNIRPILTIIDGKLALLEKVRTQRAAMDRLINLLVKSAEGKEIEKVGITHINNSAGAAELETRLRQELKLPSEIIVAEFTPGLSVHGGTGLVAGIILTK
jgi:DegV family protein with EDD domain